MMAGASTAVRSSDWLDFARFTTALRRQSSGRWGAGGETTRTDTTTNEHRTSNRRTESRETRTPCRMERQANAHLPGGAAQDGTGHRSRAHARPVSRALHSRWNAPTRMERQHARSPLGRLGSAGTSRNGLPARVEFRGCGAVGLLTAPHREGSGYNDGTLRLAANNQKH